MNKEIDVYKIASFLNTKFSGENFILKYATSLTNLKNNALTFTTNKSIENTNFEEGLLICPVNFIDACDSRYTIIKVANPRLTFALIVQEFFSKKPTIGIHSSSIIGLNCSIDKSVSIGFNCHIGDDVTIGKNTIINNNTVIYDNTIIGNNCYIKSGAVIGEEGFGFEADETGKPIRIPHIGNVIIKDNVEIGANTVISRGTLDSTLIEKNVKIDDLVFIAHNCSIGESTLIIAGAEISGSVTIGKNCWIAPHATIIQKVSIGDNTIVGIGALILKDISSHQKIMGLEGLELKKLIKLKRKISYGK